MASIHQDKGAAENLSRFESAASAPMTLDMFEKLYLAPERRGASRPLIKTFANPTPLPIITFLLAAHPLSMTLMGWRGAGGGGAAFIGAFWFGGMAQFIGGFMEFFIGNTFSFIIFTSIGTFLLSFAATLTPAFNAMGAYTAKATTPAETEAALASFQATLALYILCVAVLFTIYTVLSLRVNVVFFSTIALLCAGLWCLAAAYFKGAEGAGESYERLEKAAGGCIFAASILGWYLFIVQMMAAVDFPLHLPVFDLSMRFPSGSKKRAPQDAEA